jgi:hypothetical protein
LQVERWWGREIVTPEMVDFGHRLCQALGVPRSHFGSRGDNRHLNGGHRSQEWILNSRWCTSRSYTIEGGLTGEQLRHVAAFDITPASKEQMLTICGNLDRVVRQGRLEELVEWFGNVDGDRRVDGWNNIRDAVATSDSSHLTHLHGRLGRRYLRDRAVFDRLLDALLRGAVAPARPAPVPVAIGDDMPALIRWEKSPHVFLTNGITALWVQNETELADRQTLHADGTVPLGFGGKVRVVGRRSLIGVIVGSVPPGYVATP